MTRKKKEDTLADALIKQKEESDKLKKLASKAAGLASLLSNKPKIDLLRKEVMRRLPIIFMKLAEKIEFFKNKSPGNIINLYKEIDICEKYIDILDKDMTVDKAVEILEWTEKIDSKYGFESI
jgi:hypothetical protein